MTEEPLVNVRAEEILAALDDEQRAVALARVAQSA